MSHPSNYGREGEDKMRRRGGKNGSEEQKEQRRQAVKRLIEIDSVTG